MSKLYRQEIKKWEAHYPVHYQQQIMREPEDQLWLYFYPKEEKEQFLQWWREEGKSVWVSWKEEQKGRGAISE